MTTPPEATSAAIYRSAKGVMHVWWRNAFVFSKNLKLNFIPPFLEPVLTLLAMGYGVGIFVHDVNGISYARFIAPSVMAVAVMNASFYECSYASYVRMYYQKHFDAIISTPVSLPQVVVGEICWGATKGVIYAVATVPILLILGVSDPAGAILAIPVCALAGFLFAAIAICFTALTSSVDALNYPAFLFITPMSLFSGTFFPLDILPVPAQVFALATLPLTHLVLPVRALTLPEAIPLFWLHILWMGVVAIFAVVIAARLMVRRLIR